MQRHKKRHALLNAAVICLYVVLFTAVLSTVALAAQRQRLEGVPVEGRYAISAAIGQDQAEYHVRGMGGVLEADNTAQGLGARFTAAGIEIAAGGSRFRLQPVQWGYGRELELLPEGMPQAVGNMVMYRRAGVSEWYVNGPMGMQQGFTVAERPQRGAGPLRVVLALEGAHAGGLDADGRGVMLTGADGVQFRYGGLVVQDEGGNEARAWLEASGKSLSICVDDEGMQYPLYIDPMIQAAKLTASDGAVYDWFGYSVAVSGDTVVVGAWGAAVNGKAQQGAAYVFVKPLSGWASTDSFAAKLTVSHGAAGDLFGYSVAVSGDTVVVGADEADINGKINQGAAYVFVKPSSGWITMTQTAKLTASDGAQYNIFGYSLAISGDTVVVGAAYAAVNGNNLQGAAYVFVKPLLSGWATTDTFAAKLTASDGAANDNFGSSVAVSGDTVVVGAWEAAVNGKGEQGAAYVFVKPLSGWATTDTFAAKLTASDGAAVDHCGASAAASGDTVVAGAFGAAVNGKSGQGAVYIFNTGICPSQKVLGEDNPDLGALRAFRDNTLAQSAVGRRIIEIYYANSASINAALDRSPLLQASAKKMLEAIAPLLGR